MNDEAWFIDSIDRRAGLAFASFRLADLSASSPDLGVPSVFIGPPIFRPETLSSRSIALAATRGSFELGFYLDGAEVAFRELEAVIELVRRCYLSGGGGDAGGGGGGGVPPLPLDSPPNLRDPDIRPDEEAQDVALWMCRAAQEFDGRAMALARAGATFDEAPRIDAFAGARFAASQGRAASGPGLTLAAAGAELLGEILRRIDFAGDDTAILYALEAGQRLSDALARLGLWPFLLRGPLQHFVGRAVNDLLKRDGHDRLGLAKQWASVSNQSDIAFRLLSSVEPYLFVEPRADFKALGYPSYGYRSRPLRESDPMDDLAMWPIPPEFHRWFPAGESGSSLANLLSLVAGSPDVLAVVPPGDRVGQRAASLALFAATHVCARARSAPPPNALLANAGFDAVATAGAVEAAVAWLRAQWPRFIYRKEIETMIGQVGHLAI